MTLEIHPALRHLQFLIGTWKGSGRGDYPTIDAFTYGEECTFGHTGKPFLTYSQRTWGSDGAPLHSEVGYLRPGAGGQVELTLAHPTGITEIQVGTVAEGRLSLHSTAIGLSPTAKDVRKLHRVIEVAGDTLRYVVEMAAVGEPLQVHLEAELSRSA